MVMEKSVLVPEVCLAGSMTSAADPTFLPPCLRGIPLLF